MFLASAKLYDEVARDHALDVDHAHLYKTVKHEFHDILQMKSSRLYYDMLWDHLVPKGNIYRYAGIAAERLKNSADLWSQLYELANVCPAVTHLSDLEEKARAILKALERTRVVRSPCGTDNVGFEPLEWFLTDIQATSFGPIVYPVQWDTRATWFKLRVMAFLVCAIQWIAPLAICMYQWKGARLETNSVKNLDSFLQTLSWKDLFCLGLTTYDKLYNGLGILILSLVLLIIYIYVKDQGDNAHKAGRLPLVGFWYVLGNVTNIWCCFMTAFAVTILLWNEGSPTSLAMDSVSVLFIFVLDDFTGYACQFTGISDDDFQRAVSWQLALLSQCPISLKDLVKAEAETIDEIWYIGFNKDGKLLQATSTDEESRLCERRLQRTKPDETSSLQSERTSLLYRQYIGDPGEVMPPLAANVLEFLWSALSIFLLVLQFATPFLWMANNQPCSSGAV